ncbi:hypothetical protein E2C01_002845 [Portunus trituberculatus]|uniref:Alpha/beta hydrolase n=1 Tax=Portunus trituberculatus TaxID=210409 RepID=A0A5B7CRS5_PORTR|nr:hypothetical protein [Portunus trituberculatus]
MYGGTAQTKEYQSSRILGTDPLPWVRLDSCVRMGRPLLFLPGFPGTENTVIPPLPLFAHKF